MKPVLLCDMDGVLCDLLPAWLHEYGERTCEWLHPDSITAYNHEKFVSDPETWWACLGDALQQATPVVGSSVFNELCDKYDTYVVTYAHHAAPNAHKTKLDWLARYFPAFPQERVIFTGAKHLVRGDLLIEDSVANCDAWDVVNPEGSSILMAAPYNRGRDDIWTWAQIAKELLR